MSKQQIGQYKGRFLRDSELEEAVLTIFSMAPTSSFNEDIIAKKLGVLNPKDGIAKLLSKLSGQGVLAKKSKKGYTLSKQPPGKNDRRFGRNTAQQTTIGRVDMTRTGSAYVVVEGMEQDVYVSAKQLGNALHGDTVKISWGLSFRGKPEGQVIDVVTRATDTFVGTIQLSKSFAFVIPDNENVPVDIYVTLPNSMEAKHGDKVVVQVIKWHGEKNLINPLGKVTQVLGKGGSNVEMISILLAKGFSESFPPEVLRESESIETHISEGEIAKRRDMRNVTTFTIDPYNAKDFDDALSFQQLENGSIEIGVHIADVTHYLKAGTLLDNEAFRRSTSVYLVDRVAPMLPERLSNELCSLRPHEDKLCFSAIFQFSEEGELKQNKTWFGRTVIHSDRRFTYEEAQEVLETHEGDYNEELLKLNEIAHKLRHKRYKNGAISFEAPEVYFKLDENGKPLEVKTKIRKDAHMLIEDFMLLANRLVGEHLNQHEPAPPFIYRIHDLPDTARLGELAEFAKAFGYSLEYQGDPKKIAISLNNMMQKAQNTPELDVLQQIAVRCMAKAVYSSENIGHYGLAFSHYSHFTSPIRRYADVLAHRLLENFLETRKTGIEKQKLEEQCKYISMQERKATECERESIKYKQVEFIMDQVGKTFEGIITGFAGHGIFVQIIENHCEGRVSFDQTPEPYETESLKIRGIKTGKVIRMGDKVMVKVLDADLQKKLIDLRLIY